MMFLHLTIYYFLSERTALTSGDLFKLMIPSEWAVMATISLLAYCFSPHHSDDSEIPHASILTLSLAAGLGLVCLVALAFAFGWRQEQKSSSSNEYEYEPEHEHELASDSDDEKSHDTSVSSS